MKEDECMDLLKNTMSETLDAGKRLVYMDLLRVFCIFSMIVLHVSGARWSFIPTSSFEWQVLNFYDASVRFCVPVFIMISGAFLLNGNKNYTVKDIFTKKLSRIAAAFFFWSAVYAVLGGEFTSPSMFFAALFRGHYHMWFLFTIAALYMITPFLREICKRKNLMEYFIILWFAFFSLGTMLNLIPGVPNYILSFKNSIAPIFISGYTGYYVLGYYLFSCPLSKKMYNLMYFLGGISVILTILGTSAISSSGVANPMLYENLLPNTLFTSCAVFVFFKEKVSKINFRANAVKFISTLSAISFGIYLCHDIFILALLHFGVRTDCFLPVLSVLFISVTVFLLGGVVSYVLNKIPVVNKYIV